MRLADKTNEKKLEIDNKMLYIKKRPHTKRQQKGIFDNVSSKKNPLSDRQQPVKSMHKNTVFFKLGNLSQKDKKIEKLYSCIPNDRVKD